MTDTKKTDTKTPVAFIGLGMMGAHMAGHILDAGHPLHVYNRTRARAEPLIARGATWHDDAGAAASQASIVITMVGLPRDVEDIYLGQGGILARAAPGAILVDMTTSSPSLAVRIAAAAKAKGLRALDAPVSGGDIGARNGSLSIMVGGETHAYEAVRPLLECMGSTIVHQGPAGAGQHTKLTNQIVVAGNLVAVCEALLYATRAGLDVESVLESISGGAASSWALSNLAPRIVEGDYAPGFFVDHFVKDMGIALEEAARMQIAMPGLALAHQLYVALQAQGHGRDGTQSLILALEAISPE